MQDTRGAPRTAVNWLVRRCGDVKGQAGHYRRHCREAPGQRGREGLRSRPVLGLRAAGPLPGRGRGGVRAAVPAAEDVSVRDQRRRSRPDHPAAQRPRRAGPGRRPADHRLAPGAPPPGQSVSRDRQQVPEPGGLVTPAPAKRPKSSYIRFEADMPDECWQSGFTRYPLAGGTDTEIMTWPGDHSRYALPVTAHARVTGPASCWPSAQHASSTASRPPP
jgi:hypothetical protein